LGSLPLPNRWYDLKAATLKTIKTQTSLIPIVSGSLCALAAVLATINTYYLLFVLQNQLIALRSGMNGNVTEKIYADAVVASKPQPPILDSGGLQIQLGKNSGSLPTVADKRLRTLVLL
jgi:hypothetical protein